MRTLYFLYLVVCVAMSACVLNGWIDTSPARAVYFMGALYFGGKMAEASNREGAR